MRNKCFEKCYKIRWKTPVIIAKHFKKAFLQNTSVWLFLSVGNTIFQPVWKKENFFFPSGFSFTDTDDSQGKGRDHLLFHSTTSTRSRTLRNLFATLHVRWLSCILTGNIMYTKWQSLSDAVQINLMNDFLEPFLLVFGENKYTTLKRYWTTFCYKTNYNH